MNEPPATLPPRVVGLGESLLRLSAPGHERLEQAADLRVHVGGAEMNVLIGAAALGLPATWLTRLADNPLGRRVAAHARAHGVAAHVDWDGAARAPLYFVEHGAHPRPSEVLYDRSATAMTRLTPDTFAWDDAVAGAGAAVCSGITCALGPGPAAAVEALFAAARRAGAHTAFDVNHRAKLWTWEQAVPVLRRLLPSVDLLLAGRQDLLRLLPDASPEETQVALAHRAITEFGCGTVVLRETAQLTGRRVATSVVAVTAGGEVASPTYEADVVDAFGAGDAALGALIASRLTGDDLAAAVDKAAWAGAFQHTLPGDACTMRPADLGRRGAPARRILR
ncbi:sugar kinase [Actinomadura fibrosa]|uniref:Sugar kinase n=1 Tax=Actinomadura fibrosa TaxID=111802 RepID=A0ABW2XQM0_9ACTN|nr:sugar kinase [Actinomadura fibrosa]